MSVRMKSVKIVKVNMKLKTKDGFIKRSIMDSVLVNLRENNDVMRMSTLHTNPNKRLGMKPPLLLER